MITKKIILGYCFLPLLCFLWTPFVLAQNSDLSSRIANYDIKVQLDVEQKKLLGEETIVWKNNSTDTIRQMPLHLYYNAFKNSESSLLREWYKLPPYFSTQLEYGGDWAWININKITDSQGNNLLASSRFTQPDDQNEKDETVLFFDLIQPVLPGQSISLKIDWESKIPRAMIRSGYNKDFYFIGQWYPKIGVYEAAGTRYATTGKWNCHQYHLKGEFYADFGVYDVAITVPQNFVMGATGVLTDEKTADATKTYRYHAEDVIDFAWTASPDFVVQNTAWEGVNIQYLSYPDHSYMADRYFEVIRYSMDFFDSLLGKYPYPQLTLVEPPFHGLFAMAMEYPTLVTVGSFGFLPKGIKTAETLAAHEFIHQYFMQMIATNETEEAWLDEGLTTYFEGRIMDEYCAEKKSAVVDWMGVQITQKDLTRNTYANEGNPKIAPADRAAWEYPNGGYELISYKKTGLCLWTLEGLIGTPTMDEILKTYFQRWKFQHPCASDFIAIVNEVVQKNHGDAFGENMNWFFDQMLHTTAACDYKVAYIGNFPNKAPMGIDVAEASKQAERPRYLSKVVLQRVEEMQLPVEVLFTFYDGHTELAKWDGKERSQTFFFSRDYGVKSAEIDPERKICLDENYLNNSYTYSPDRIAVRKYVGKVMVWMQQVMQTMVAFV